MNNEQAIKPIDEWIEYLKRANRGIREGARLKLFREVGKHYGLTEDEMDAVANGDYILRTNA